MDHGCFNMAATYLVSASYNGMRIPQGNNVLGLFRWGTLDQSGLHSRFLAAEREISLEQSFQFRPKMFVLL